MLMCSEGFQPQWSLQLLLNKCVNDLMIECDLTGHLYICARQLVRAIRSFYSAGASDNQQGHSAPSPLCHLRQISKYWYFFFFFNWKTVYLKIFVNVDSSLRERDTEHEQGRSREGDTESKAGSRIWAVSTEPDAGLELTNREIVTWAKVGRPTEWATQVPPSFICMLNNTLLYGYMDMCYLVYAPISGWAFGWFPVAGY